MTSLLDRFLALWRHEWRVAVVQKYFRERRLVKLEEVWLKQDSAKDGRKAMQNLEGKVVKLNTRKKKHHHDDFHAEVSVAVDSKSQHSGESYAADI